MDYYYDEEDNKPNEKFSSIELLILRIHTRLHEKMNNMPLFVTEALDYFCTFDNIISLAKNVEGGYEILDNESKKSNSTLEKIIENSFLNISKTCFQKYQWLLKYARDLGSIDPEEFNRQNPHKLQFPIKPISIRDHNLDTTNENLLIDEIIIKTNEYSILIFFSPFFIYFL